MVHRHIPVWAGNRCHLGVDDELTIYTAAALKPALLDPLDSADEVEVDLSRVGECDSAGFQLLVLLKREVAAGACASPATARLC